jgi:hypothetical protein
MADTDLTKCSCLEVFGEDPDCPLHGTDALEAQIAEKDARIAELEAQWSHFQKLASEHRAELEAELTASRAECEGLRAALETLCNAVMADVKEAKSRLDADIAKDAPVHPVSAFLTGMAIHVGKARAALSQKETGDE